MTPQHFNKGRKLPIEVLTVEEYVGLLRAAGPVGATGAVRNRALMATLYGAGVRVSEALKLYPKDIDLQAGAIRVLFGKGAGKGYRARTGGIDPDNLALISDWIDRRKEIGLGPLAPLFCTYSKPTPGLPLDSAQIRRLLPRLGRLAGITKRVHAHGLRHSLAAQLDAEGMSTALVQRQLGHANIGTTSGYLDHIRPAAVIAAMQERRVLGDALETLRPKQEEKEK